MSPRSARKAQNKVSTGAPKMAPRVDFGPRTCPELARNLPFDELLLQNAENKRGAAVLPPRGLSIK